MDYEGSEILLRHGNFAYRLKADWIKWPKHIRERVVSGVFWHGGELFATTRDPSYPIVVFDRGGEYIRHFGKKLDFGGTHGIWISPDGTIRICDTGNHILYHMDREGRVLSVMGERGVCSDTGYDSSFSYPYMQHTIRRRAGPFHSPTRIVEAPSGELYCSDGYGNAAVHRFSANGELLQSWGTPGVRPGEFLLVHSIWVDSRNQVWVADRDNYTVHVFSADGAPLRRFERLLYQAHPRGPSDLWGDGVYVYASLQFGGVAIFTEALEQAALLGRPLIPPMGHSMCGDELGNLYFGILHGDETVVKLERC